MTTHEAIALGYVVGVLLCEFSHWFKNRSER